MTCIGNVLRSVSHQSDKIYQVRSINHPRWLFAYYQQTPAVFLMEPGQTATLNGVSKIT